MKKIYVFCLMIGGISKQAYYRSKIIMFPLDIIEIIKT